MDLFSSEALSPAIYETTASDYDRFRKADSSLVAGLIHHLQIHQKGRYLDIGCGSGNYTLALAEKGIAIEGLDISPAMLDQARAKAPERPWVFGDMHALPYAANAFDGIITMNTIHYVGNSLVQVLQEMRRVLKPGATLVIYIIALEQCLAYWVGHYFPFFYDVGQKSLLPQETIREALMTAGFSDVQMDPFFVTEQTSDLFAHACKYRPHFFLDPKVRSGMTPFQRPEYSQEIEKGCEQLRRDLASGAIYRIIAQHESRTGEGLFISGRKN